MTSKQYLDYPVYYQDEVYYYCQVDNGYAKFHKHYYWH